MINKEANVEVEVDHQTNEKIHQMNEIVTLHHQPLQHHQHQHQHHVVIMIMEMEMEMVMSKRNDEVEVVAATEIDQRAEVEVGEEAHHRIDITPFVARVRSLITILLYDLWQ
jgi:hypothetical protein